MHGSPSFLPIVIPKIHQKELIGHFHPPKKHPVTPKLRRCRQFGPPKNPTGKTPSVSSPQEVMTGKKKGRPFSAAIFFVKKPSKIVFPIGSMYGIFTYIWLICMVNVAKYTIHGSYGFDSAATAPSPRSYVQRRLVRLHGEILKQVPRPGAEFQHTDDVPTPIPIEVNTTLLVGLKKTEKKRKNSRSGTWNPPQKKIVGFCM